MENKEEHGEVIFITPVPYITSPVPGLVFVALEHLVEAQKEFKQSQLEILDKCLEIVGEDEQEAFGQDPQEPAIDEEAVIRNKLRKEIRTKLLALKETLI